MTYNQESDEKVCIGLGRKRDKLGKLDKVEMMER